MLVECLPCAGRPRAVFCFFLVLYAIVSCPKIILSLICKRHRVAPFTAPLLRLFMASRATPNLQLSRCLRQSPLQQPLRFWTRLEKKYLMGKKLSLSRSLSKSRRRARPGWLWRKESQRRRRGQQISSNMPKQVSTAEPHAPNSAVSGELPMARQMKKLRKNERAMQITVMAGLGGVMTGFPCR